MAVDVSIFPKFVDASGPRVWYGASMKINITDKPVLQALDNLSATAVFEHPHSSRAYMVVDPCRVHITDLSALSVLCVGLETGELKLFKGDLEVAVLRNVEITGVV